MSSKTIKLYYSPRVLDDNDEKTNDNDVDDTKKTDKLLKRFIHSIIRCEQQKFTELLPKVDINSNGTRNGPRWSPILWAIQKHRIIYIQQMFNSSQFIDFSKHTDHKTNRTTLHFAAERGHLKLVMLLLNKDKEQFDLPESCRLNIDAQDREKSTALYRAAKIGADVIIKVLLEHGADPNICNRDGVSPLIASSIRGHLSAVEQLLGDKRTDINIENKRGQNALMCACAEDRMAVTKLLLQQENVNFNAMDRENFSWNCLMWCVYRKNEKMLKVLLGHDTFDRYKGFKIDYFHENYYKQNVLEMCIQKKLSSDVESMIRSKFHALLFPELVGSNLIVSLKIPIVVVGVVLVFTY